METVYEYCMFINATVPLANVFVWVQRESPHSMSLQIMAFLRGELLHFSPASPPSPPSPPSLFLLFLPFCSPTPPLLPFAFLFLSPHYLVSHSLHLHTTLLSSNVFPVCLTGGHRQKGNLSQGQTDSTDTVLQTVAPTLAAVLKKDISSRYTLVRLISTLERHQ